MKKQKEDTSDLQGIKLTPELIDSFLMNLHNRGRTPETQNLYRQKLEQLYEVLPEDKLIFPGTLQEIRESLQQQGMSNGTINLFFSAANNLLDHCGHRELQLHRALDQQSPIPPELTRTEYLRLLSTARMLEKERPYLLTKLFVNTGLYIRELPFVTVETVKEGRMMIPERGPVHISHCLCEELLEYCQRIGVTTGEIFITSGGKSLSRSAVNREIKTLANDAQVQSEKCNPLSLRRLYLKTQETIQSSLLLLMEQSHDRMMETEQMRIGWKAGG